MDSGIRRFIQIVTSPIPMLTLTLYAGEKLFRGVPQEARCVNRRAISGTWSISIHLLTGRVGDGTGKANSPARMS
jgi:hypothetical protein